MQYTQQCTDLPDPCNLRVQFTCIIAKKQTFPHNIPLKYSNISKQILIFASANKIAR